MSEQIIDVTRQSAATPDAVFDLLLDAPGWPTWSPLGEGSVPSPATTGPGGLGEIRVFRTGRYTSTERVIASDRPSHFAYELVSGLPLRGYRAHVRVTPTASGCTINWRSTFHAKLPGTGWIFRRKLGAFIAELVDGLAAAAAMAPARSR